MQSFHLTLIPGQHIEPDPLITLRPKPAIQMRLTAREALSTPSMALDA
jgi:hypothetical protein